MQPDNQDQTGGPFPLDPNDPENLVNLSRTEDLPDGPPDDTDNNVIEHQQQDANQEESEIVDEGTDGAAEIHDPLRTGPPRDYSPQDPAAEGYDEDGTEEVNGDDHTKDSL